MQCKFTKCEPKPNEMKISVIFEMTKKGQTDLAKVNLNSVGNE